MSKETEFEFPKFNDILRRLLDDGLITQSDADKYLANYEFFQQNRDVIENDANIRKWVGSINGKIIFADSIEELRKLISQEPDSNRGYIEQVVVRG